MTERIPTPRTLHAGAHPSNLPEGRLREVYEYFYDQQRYCDTGSVMWHSLQKYMGFLLALNDNAVPQAPATVRRGDSQEPSGSDPALTISKPAGAAPTSAPSETVPIVSTNDPLTSTAPSATGETSRWHQAFRHYFHDGAEDCRQCGLSRDDRIHDMSASTDGGADNG